MKTKLKIIATLLAAAVSGTAQAPAPATVNAGTNCTATADLRSKVVVSDNSAAPVIITQTPSPVTPLGLGTHTLTFVATDAAGNQSAPCTTTVTVVDVMPPIVTSVTPSKKQLWPPNEKMVPITISATAIDNCSSVSVRPNQLGGRWGLRQRWRREM